MTQPAQTNALAVSDWLPAQQGLSAASAALDFTGKKKADGGELEEHGSSPGENQETEHLLKLVASLEACNMALLNKLNQAERELAALRQTPAHTLLQAEPAANPEQSFGWERKLTRTQWRPS